MNNLSIYSSNSNALKIDGFIIGSQLTSHYFGIYNIRYVVMFIEFNDINCCEP